jgi:hypothetical protein
MLKFQFFYNIFTLVTYEQAHVDGESAAPFGPGPRPEGDPNILLFNLKIEGIVKLYVK